MKNYTISLKQDFEIPDTVTKLAIDTIKIDTLFQYKKIFIHAGKSCWQFGKPG